jgi:hypothetical protein
MGVPRLPAFRFKRAPRKCAPALVSDYLGELAWAVDFCGPRHTRQRGLRPAPTVDPARPAGHVCAHGATAFVPIRGSAVAPQR